MPDTTGCDLEGILHMAEGRLFMDDIPVHEAIHQFIGRYVSLKIEAHVVPPDYPIDEKILPLVEAMQQSGLVTLASCEGHMDVGDGRYRYPYVAFYSDEFGVDPFALLPIDTDAWAAWVVVKIADYVYRLKTKQTAETEEQLEALQREIEILAQQLQA